MYTKAKIVTVHTHFIQHELRHDLLVIDKDHLAFMFNGGQFPALSIHPIDTKVCMMHLWHNI